MTARFFVLVGVDDPDRMHNALDLAATSMHANEK
jgi:hypothetical protein